MPITVAVAGSSETSSAYVARRIRAIASWSNTYGMTDDEIPTPMPAASRTGSAKRRRGVPDADRYHRDQGDDHGRGEPVDPAHPTLGHPVRQHDVRREEPGVEEREQDADRLALEPHVGEQVDAADRGGQREAVPPRPRPERRERDHRQELDRGDRAQREPVDREVEARVHRREDQSHRDHGAVPEQPPRTPPDGEDDRGARDPEPRDTEWLDPGEEQDGERGPEVVEDGADDEEALGRRGRGESTETSAHRHNSRAARGEMPYDSKALDETDRRLLRELQENARLSLAELGRRVNLSSPAVAERLARLERTGVVTGYSAEVDPKAIGYPIAALVRIRPTTRQLQKIPELAREVPEVVECHRVTGEDCFVLKLHLRAMDDLEDILDRFIVLGQTTTSIIHSTPIAGRQLPL